MRFENSLKRGALRIAFVAATLMTTTAWAQNAADVGSDPDAFASLETGFAPGEVPPRNVPYQSVPEVPANPPQSDWHSRWDNWKADLTKKTGTSFELFLNPSDQFIVTGPDDGTNRGIIWFNFSLNQKLWDGARLVTNTRGGQGAGVNRYVDSLFNFNQHAGETTAVYVSHFFLEQKLFDDRITLAAGKMDLLDNFDDNEVGGWNLIPYSLARNPSIPAPFHVIGARARFDPTEWMYVEAGIADAGGNASETGLNTAFDNGEPYFSIFEAGFKPKFLNRPGTYRFIFWHNSGDIAHFDGSGVDDGDNGVALSFDQQITDHLSLFARYGYSDPDVRRMNHYFSAGGSYSEPLPGRKNDVAGVAVAHALLSHDYRQAVGVDSTATQFDLYYKIQLTPWMSVTPDLQVILNPDQDTSENVALIAGVWGEIRF